MSGITIPVGMLSSGLFMLQIFIHSFLLASEVPALIPYPQKITWTHPDFRVKHSIILDCQINREQKSVKELFDFFDSHGSELVTAGIPQQKKSSKQPPTVHINLLPGTFEPEGYRLTVSGSEIILEAGTSEGLYHGVQTLKQLLLSDKGGFYFKGCMIEDWPAFRIRGFMQDVGRNYMPVSLLKEQIDVMAAYKFNVFHFHVTDNPGWRLESKKYPQLKDASSMSRWKGKYYSQKDFTGLVEYCNERHILLIPEFDVPGHSAAFRKAFSIDSMSDQRVKPILLDLIDELCELVPAEKMPYIHLGTDEVWNKAERPSAGLLSALMERIRFHHREVMVWRPGQQVEGDESSITQLWSSNGRPRPGHRYIDSRLNYLNHLDPLAGIPQLYFDRICGASRGDSLRLGGILCCWNDNNVSDPGDILRHNPVYPGMLTYSESLWKGLEPDPGENYLAKLPEPDNLFFSKFSEFENRLIAHRNLYFRDKSFPYVRQSDIVWQLIGPFNNEGDANRIFPVEDSIKNVYTVNEAEYKWRKSVYGGTIHIRHFFGYPSLISEKAGTVYASTKIWSPVNQETGFWIGFHDWSRSGGRRGGPLPQQGQWHKTNPKVWVNKREIAPPVWNNPGLGEKTEEIPFTDENYSFRKPVNISLKKGWNQVLLKVPQDGTSWKWMFTFVPVNWKEGSVSEPNGLRYRSIFK